MSEASFKALLIEERSKPPVLRKDLTEVDLPPGDVTIGVEYSSLNYKDALAITGKGNIIRAFPMVPGIDLAGTVIHSTTPAVVAGQSVIATGRGLGESFWGGYSTRARIQSRAIVPLPPGLTLRQSMVIGTAGFTAMISILKLEAHGLSPEGGEVLVTGASGGVGSFSIALLAKRGYRVVASTGRREEEPYLRSLGAARVIDRKTLSEVGHPLESESWQGAIDSVGGSTLANVVASICRGGSVAACGLAGGIDIPVTVFPFILRGVNLLGIDSNECPAELRNTAWKHLAEDTREILACDIAKEISLEEVPHFSEELLANHVRGRIVVRVA